MGEAIGVHAVLGGAKLDYPLFSQPAIPSGKDERYVARVLQLAFLSPTQLRRS
jgi:hypothetical protein